MSDRYELIAGDTGLINILIADGWKIENTFPNPYPQPYFFALMRLPEGMDHLRGWYDLKNVENHFYRAGKLSQWKESKEFEENPE